MPFGIDPHNWPDLSRLLDQALDLAARARTRGSKHSECATRS